MKKICMFSAFILLTAGCSSVPITGRNQLSLVSDSEITQMSEQSYKDIISKSQIVKTGPEADMVKTVGTKIAAAAEAFLKESGKGADIANYSWEFNLIKDDKTVNAFCMPGGKIAVYTGILPYTKNADGLAVVIGHEVAHAIAKHGQERMSQQLLAQYGGSLVSVFTAQKSQETQQFVMLAYGAGTQVGVLLPYSRKHEFEADAYAVKTYKNPQSMIDALKKLSVDNLSNLTPHPFKVFLEYSHPPVLERIKAIKDNY